MFSGKGGFQDPFPLYRYDLLVPGRTEPPSGPSNTAGEKKKCGHFPCSSSRTPTASSNRPRNTHTDTHTHAAMCPNVRAAALRSIHERKSAMGRVRQLPIRLRLPSPCVHGGFVTIDWPTNPMALAIVVVVVVLGRVDEKKDC